jgi:hypothetical protein
MNIHEAFKWANEGSERLIRPVGMECWGIAVVRDYEISWCNVTGDERRGPLVTSVQQRFYEYDTEHEALTFFSSDGDIEGWSPNVPAHWILEPLEWEVVTEEMLEAEAKAVASLATQGEAKDELIL